MRQHRRSPPQRLLGSFLVLTLVHTACFGTPGVNDGQAIENARLTLEAGLTQSDPPADLAEAQQEAQEVEEPQAEVTQTETPVADVVQGAATVTFTVTAASSNPTVSVSTATNCRSGPGAPFAINGALSPGQTANVTAQTSVNNYVLIQNPSNGPDCWLWLQYATVTGDISSLAVVTPPASPTPTLTFTPAITPTLVATQAFSWTGTWTTTIDPGGFADVNTFSLTQSGTSVSGSGSGWTISGTTSGANNMTLSGGYSFPLIGTGGTCGGTFTWQAIAGSSDQFRGNIIWCVGSVTLSMCGHRNGAGYPSPCLGP